MAVYFAFAWHATGKLRMDPALGQSSLRSGCSIFICALVYIFLCWNAVLHRLKQKSATFLFCGPIQKGKIFADRLSKAQMFSYGNISLLH